MVVAKRQGREKPVKIEQRKVQGPEWGPQVEQIALLLAQFTQVRLRGRKKYIKRGAKEPEVFLRRSCRLSISFSPSLPPSLSLSLSPLHVFWVGMPSHLEDVFSFYFLNKTELLHGAVTLICPRAIIVSVWEPRGIVWSVWEPRAVTRTVRELWCAEGYNVCHFKFLLWQDRTEEITHSPDKSKLSC